MHFTVFAFMIILLGTWALPLSIHGQSGFKNDLYLQLDYRPGLVMPEYSLFTYLVNDYVHSFECTISKRSSGKNFWQQIYNYPEYGMAWQYATLGNDKVFGREISIYPFYKIYLLDAGRFALINKAGLGLGFANKKFDAESNPYNVAIGSHLNVHFNFELNAQYQLLKKWAVTTGIGFDHLSNGNFAEPNLGINYFTFHGGLRYLLHHESERVFQTLEPHIPVTTTAFILSGGAKNARSLQDRKYFISSLSFELKRKLWRKFSPGIGADLFYDGATKVEMRSFAKEQTWSTVDDFKTGLHLSLELVYNKFSVSVQEGFYIGLKDKVFDNKMYQRLIIRHRMNTRTFFQLSMKAHSAVLDYMEFGVGYSGKT